MNSRTCPPPIPKHMSMIDASSTIQNMRSISMPTALTRDLRRNALSRSYHTPAAAPRAKQYSACSACTDTYICTAYLKNRDSSPPLGASSSS